ncbi:MAG: exosortase family protein XrtG, partial [Clostridium sp.]
FFTIGIFFFRDILETIIINVELWLFEIFNKILYSLEIFIQDETIIVKTTNVVKGIRLNYECSGLIEMLVYSSIVLFYPIHNNWNKLKKFILGNLVILAANMFRLLLMVMSVGFIGIETFEVVHLLIGRIVFYIIIIILYYKVLTKYHISQYKEV